MTEPIKIGRATIDVTPIAAGIISIAKEIDENNGNEAYETALRFGMLPGPLMLLLDKQLKEKAKEIGEDERWARDAAHQISVEIYSQGNLVV